jgi:hypothetical protein
VLGGAVIDAKDRDKLLQFEKTLIETQMDLEDRFKVSFPLFHPVFDK